MNIALLIEGIPGAGKTFLSNEIKTKFGENCIVLNTDLFFYPKENEILINYLKQEEFFYIDQFGGNRHYSLSYAIDSNKFNDIIINEFCNHVMSKLNIKYNIVVVEGYVIKKVKQRLIEKLMQNGYISEVITMISKEIKIDDIIIENNSERLNILFNYLNTKGNS